MTSAQPMIERVVAPGAPAPLGHYAPAVVSPDGTIWVSAQLPVAGDEHHRSSLAEEAHQALANVVAIVEAAGGTVASVVKVTLYLVTSTTGRPPTRRSPRRSVGTVRRVP